MYDVIRLVHLSDIHFSHRASAHGFNPDEDIRNEIIRDVEKHANELGPMTALVVTGDIAYAGKKAEFSNAAGWLDNVCRAGQCPPENVYVCPGNHDVDRDVIQMNGLLQDAISAAKNKSDTLDMDEHLGRRLAEPQAGKIFYSALSEFNEFAARYECSFFPDAYAWDKDLPFHDGSVLRIRGLNSALLSGPTDYEGGLFLGANAYTLNRHPGVEYLTICHHPPSWLRDKREADGHLSDRARLQLFGHEHDQRTLVTQDYVRLFAGSVNPHRKEPHWCPGYNIIEISIRGRDDNRQMHVRVYARHWQTGQHCQFRNILTRDGEEFFESTFKLGPWSAPDPANTEELKMNSPSEDPQEDSTEIGESPELLPVSMRQITYEFFKLGVSRKAEIMGALKLIDNIDTTLPEVQRYKQAIEAARERNMLEELHRLIKSDPK